VDRVHAVDSHDPFFFTVTSSEFRRDEIADLAAGRCAAIRVPELIPRSMCDETLRALTRVEFDSYGEERVHPQVMRFGAGVSDHRRDGEVAESYWHAVDSARDAWNELGLPFDPFQVCRDQLGAQWPNAVAVGRRDDREMAAGVAREPNGGFVIHFDDAQREFSTSLLDANLVAQFAFNLYLSVPDIGGETVVWRHRWQPVDEAFRLPGSYGYADAVVGDAEFFELKPLVGEALLFDPRNFHAVRPSHDSRRIALGFSIGMSDNGDLLAWG
jgi:hypothetical protein